ncbi:MAG: tetratricopeptide repeat protein [Bacteroidota bacterium]
MLPQQVTAAIEALIGQGQLEQALDQLVIILDSDPQYAELAKAARVNQGELYQVKAQVLKGTIDTEDAQLANNKIADRALEIIKLAKLGRVTLENEQTPSPRKAWRYYAAGGIVTLAAVLLIWRFFGTAASDCPRFKPEIKFRVLILPFRQTGENKTGEPAIEIADGLNTLISKTPNLDTISTVEVKDNYTDGYPSPQHAEEIANQCGVQMIVWGKINQTSTENYKLDIRYRLLNAGKVYGSGDTSVNNLLESKNQGQLIRDIGTVTEMLYIVLANKANVPVNNSLFASLMPKLSASDIEKSGSKPDTSLLLLLAANVYRQNPKEAIKIYDQVIKEYPEHTEARQKRGALLYEQGDYAGAVRDLDFAAPNAANASPDLLKYRADAALQSGQPIKAQDDIDVLSTRKTDKNDSNWVLEKRKAVEDSLANLRIYRDKLEKQVKSQPRNVKARIKAAKANNQLGEPERSLKVLNVSSDKAAPKSDQEAVIAIEAHLMKHDTVSARSVLAKAEKAGFNVKGFQDRVGTVKALVPAKLQPH